MPLTILYRGPTERGVSWRQKVLALLPDTRWYDWPTVPEPEQVDALITWLPPDNYQQLLPNLQLIFSVGAGVDQFSPATLPPHIRLVRMIDPGINKMMSSFVLSAVLMLHRQHLAYAQQQRNSLWQPQSVALPEECRVGIMGLGQLGAGIAGQLAYLGFQVAGWSQSAKQLPGVTTFAGQTALADFLSGLDILVCLLPLTDDTRDILCRDTLQQLPVGAALINAGRGQHLVEDDLLQLLNSGHLSYAVLDVFRQEPLPAEHPFWQHPAIHITPHIAAVTRHDSAGQQLAANLQRFLAGAAMAGEVDKQKGY